MGLLKHCTYLLGFLFGVVFTANVAFAAPDSFVYEGVLEDSSGAITTATTLTLKIYDPAQACLLYEESQIVTPGTDGSFSVRVGSDTASIKRTGTDPGLAMGSVFSSSGTIRGTGTANCTAGYVAASSDSRRLVISVNGSDMSPAIEISSAPFAISAGSADKVGNYDSSKILRTDGTASITALNDAKVTILQNILNGTLGSAPSLSGEVASKGYVDSVASALLPASTTFAGDVSGTYSTLSVNAIKGKAVDDTGITSGKILKYDGTKWVMGNDNAGSSLSLTDGKIYVGNASGPAEVSITGDASLSNTGVLTLSSTITAGGPVGTSGYVPVITYDAKGRLTAVTSAAVNDTTKLPLAGGTMSGALNMGGQDITNTGNISMAANKYFGLSANGTDGTVAGQMWYDAGVIKYFDGSNVKSLGVAGAGITNLNGLTSVTQTFATGTSGNSPQFSSATNTHTLNIPMASASGSVTAGLLSNAEYAALNAKQSNVLASGKIWVGNATGGAQEQTVGGDATIDSSGNITVSKTQTAQASKILQLTSGSVAVTKGIDIAGTTSGAVSLKAPAVVTNYPLLFPAAQGSSNQVLANDGAGNLNWVNMAAGGVTAVAVTAPLTNFGTAASPDIGFANPPSGYPFYKWNGSNWVDTHLNVTDLRSTAGGFAQQFPTNCTNGQTLVWFSGMDAYQCQDIKIAEMAKMTTATMVLYVMASGDDATCNGFYNQSSAMAPNCAARTLQGALDKVPDIIKHNVTIYVESLGLTGPNQTLATINKAVAASDPVNGPFLRIEGNGSVKTLFGNGYTGSVGLVVGPLSRGVYLKNLNIDGFREEGLNVNGGLVLLENISMNDNATGIRANGGAQVVHQGPSPLQITLANLGGSDGSRGIEVFQASMHTETGLNINVGNSLNNRGISITQGELGLEGGTSDIQSFAGSTYLTGVEISPGGTLYIENTHNLRVNMGNNSSASAVNVRGGSLMVSGTLELINISSQGLTCENGAKCQIYGTFMANSGAGRPYVAVRSNSILQAQGYFEIGGPEGSGSAGLEISDNSIFKYNPFSPSMTFTMTGNSSNVGNVAIRLKNGSQFIFEGNMTNPSFDVANYQKLFEATANSSFIVEGNTGGISAVPGEAYVDETSTSKAQTNIPFPIPFRSCTGGLIPVGKGPGAFCIDSSSMGTQTYTGAMNECNNRGLKLCSKIQYAQYCAAGNSIGSNHWTVGVEYLTCTNASVTATNNSSFATAYNYRCCL